MFKSIRVAGALAAPLLLGACGLPVGVQIASLIADGISVLTTDKTLTDHGISAVTQQDCALWRGVEGDTICRESDTDDTVKTALADAGADASPILDAQGDLPLAEGDKPTAELPPEPAAAPAPPAAPKPILVSEKRVVVPAPRKPTGADDLSPPPLDEDKMILGAPKSPRAPAEPMQLASLKARPATAAIMPAKAAGGIGERPKRTYFIVASYHRQADAERFSGNHAALKASVLQGTAKGRTVYRVAVGPVADGARTRTRRDLKRSGFKDTWKLTLRTPRVVTELASAD